MRDVYHSYKTITEKIHRHKLIAHEFLDNSYNCSFDFLKKELKYKLQVFQPLMSNHPND